MVAGGVGVRQMVRPRGKCFAVASVLSIELEVGIRAVAATRSVMGRPLR